MAYDYVTLKNIREEISKGFDTSEDVLNPLGFNSIPNAPRVDFTASPVDRMNAVNTLWDEEYGISKESDDLLDNLQQFQVPEKKDDQDEEEEELRKEQIRQQAREKQAAIDEQVRRVLQVREEVGINLPQMQDLLDQLYIEKGIYQKAEEAGMLPDEIKLKEQKDAEEQMRLLEEEYKKQKQAIDDFDLYIQAVTGKGRYNHGKYDEEMTARGYNKDAPLDSKPFVELAKQYFNRFGEGITDEEYAAIEDEGKRRILLKQLALSQPNLSNEAIKGILETNDVQELEDLVAYKLLRNTQYTEKAIEQRNKYSEEKSLYSSEAYQQALEDNPTFGTAFVNWLKGIWRQADGLPRIQELQWDETGAGKLVDTKEQIAMDNAGAALDAHITKAAVKFWDWATNWKYKDNDSYKAIKERADRFEAKQRKRLEEWMVIEDPDTVEEFKQAIIEADKSLAEHSTQYKIAQLTQKEINYALNEEEQLDKAIGTYISRVYGTDEGIFDKEEAFWKDRVADNLTLGEIIGNTTGQFLSTAVSDLVALAGVLEVGVRGGKIEDSVLVKYANDLMETGMFFDRGEEFEQRKELGISQFYNAHSTEQDNSVLSAIDIADAVGQYGFTAATMVVSGGSSALIKGVTSAATKTFTKAAIKSAIKKATKQGLSKTLSSSTRKEILERSIAFGERLAKSGNLMATGLIGTGEGVLEAMSTYESFIKDNDKNEFYNEKLAKLSSAQGAYEAAVQYFGEENIASGKVSAEQINAYINQYRGSIIAERDAVNERLKDDAHGAAVLNLWANSFINGLANIAFKSALLSKDAQRAIRGAEQRASIRDMIGIDRTRAIPVYLKNNWKDTFQKVVKGGTKTMFGEALEEYLQTISDKASQTAMLADFIDFQKVANDPLARAAFQADTSKELGRALDAIIETSVSKEAVKAGIMGALSTGIGGFNPLGIHKLIKSARRGEYKGNKTQLGLDILGSLFNSSYLQEYNNYRAEREQAQGLVDRANLLFKDKNVSDMFDKLGTVEGFKHIMEEAKMAGDERTLRDGKVGALTSLMTVLDIIEGTSEYKRFSDIVEARKAWTEIAEDASQFDADGKYIGDNDTVRGAINQFRHDDSSLAPISPTDMTDQQVLSRLAKNAVEFSEFQEDWRKQVAEIDDIFKFTELDPYTKQAMVMARMVQRDVNLRSKQLDERLKQATSNRNLTEQDQRAMERSGLSQETISNRLVRQQAPVTDNAEREEDRVEQIFTAGDIANMSIEDRAYVLENKSKYSAEQQAAIDDFIRIARLNLIEETGDTSITEDQVTQSLIDHFSINKKANAYNKYLEDFINDPKAFRQISGKQREDETRRSVKQVYGEQVKVKDGENAAQAIARLEILKEQLRKEGKEEEARAIEQLEHGDKALSKIRMDIRRAGAIMMRAMSKTKAENLPPAERLATIRNILAAVLSGSNIDNIRDLQDKLANGEITANDFSLGGPLHNVFEALQDTFGSEGVNLDFDEVINQTKQLIDNYLADTRIPTPAPATTTTTTTTTTTQPTPTPTPAQPQERLGLEVGSLEFIDIRTREDLQEWLSTHGSDEAILALETGQKVKFAAVMVDGDVQVAVVTEHEGQSVPIGFLKLDGGSTIIKNATVVAATQLQSTGANQILLEHEGSEITSTITRLGETRSIGEQHLEESTPANQAVAESNLTLKAWVKNFLRKVKVRQQNLEDNVNQYLELDKYIVHFKKQGNSLTSFSDLTLNGQKVSDIIQQEDSAAIQALKQNPFFEEMFREWGTHITTLARAVRTDSVDAQELFRNLIGNFIYLGIKDFSTIRATADTLTVGTLNIDISGNTNAETALLNFLREIAKDVEIGQFQNHNIQISFHAINRYKRQSVLSESERGRASQKEIQRLENIIAGAVEMGFILIKEPKAITRYMSIPNPFFRATPTTPTTSEPQLATPNPVETREEESAADLFGETLAAARIASTTIIQSIQRASKRIEEAIKSRTGAVGRGVSRFTNAVVGRSFEKPNFQETPASRVATSLGNVVDAFVKEFISYLNSIVEGENSTPNFDVNNSFFNKSLDQQVNEVINHVQQTAFNGKIPNFKKEGLKLLVTGLLNFYQVARAKQWTIVSTDLFISGAQNVLNSGAVVGQVLQSGEIDLLAQDAEGKLHIIDIKTSKEPWDRVSQTTKLAYYNQIGMYEAIIRGNYQESVSFGEHYILPVTYRPVYMVPSNPVVAEDKMTILNGGQEWSTSAKPIIIENDMGGLVPVDHVPVVGLDLDAMTPEQRALVVWNEAPNPDFATSNDSTSTQEDDTASEENQDTPIENPNGKALGDDDLLSNHNYKESKVIDIINRGLRPLRRGVKVKRSRQGREAAKDLTNDVLMQDLANTFFDGNIVRCRAVVGNLVVKKNLSKVRARLLQYFSQQTSTFGSAVRQLMLSHYGSIALLQLMDGTITEEQFQQELESYGLTPTDFADYTDWVTADETAKESIAERLKQKYEILQYTSKEVFESRQKALQNTFMQNQAKEQALESLSLTTLRERLESVEWNLLNAEGQTEAQRLQNLTVKQLMNATEGTFSLRQVLEALFKNSNQTEFRHLIAQVLRALPQQIAVTIVNDTAGVEGEFNSDGSVTLYTSALTSVDRMERVLLHEAIHAIFKENVPEKVQAIYSSMRSALEEQGKTAEEINMIYGMRNVQEFIAEFFTNPVFREQLNQIQVESNSVLDNMFQAVFSRFKVDSKLNKLLYNALTQTNAARESTQSETTLNIKKTFDSLSAAEQKTLNLMGITKEQFDNMSKTEQEHQLECCR